MLREYIMPKREKDCKLAFWCLDNQPDGVLWTTLSGEILFANMAIHAMLGRTSGSLAGENLTSFDPALRLTDIGVEGHLTELVSQGKISEISTSFSRADGSYVPVKQSIAIPEDSQDRFVIFVRSIEQDLEMIDTIDRMSEGSALDDRRRDKSWLDEFLTDQLTGTWLRRRFFEVATAMVERFRRTGEPLSLLFIDVDHFKSINDSRGHNTGDAALKEIVSAIADAVRDGDYLFRWGGDEFVVPLPDTDIYQARHVAERVCAGVEGCGRPIGLSLTVSIGVAEYEEGEDLVGGLVARADAAMYRAKRDGGNTAWG